MNDYLYRFRERFHPLNYLRRYAFGRRVLRAMDIPVWIKLPGVAWKVRVRLVRHASAFLLSGGAEPAILALFSALAHEVGIRTFWDVGANFGYYTWLTKGCAATAEIRMFEPDEDNAELVRQTLHRSGANRILLRTVAVSDRQERRCFVRDEVSGSTGGIQDTMTYFSQRQWGVSGPSVMVDTVTLDSERTHTGILDLIKIDVEGHEEAVIRGGRKTIESDQPVIIFECFHGGAEIIEYLTRIGYWVGDAERMCDDFHRTTNFIALPPRHLTLLDRLKKAWSAEMMRLGRAHEHHQTGSNVV